MFYVLLFPADPNQPPRSLLKDVPAGERSFHPGQALQLGRQRMPSGEAASRFMPVSANEVGLPAGTQVPKELFVVEVDEVSGEPRVRVATRANQHSDWRLRVDPDAETVRAPDAAARARQPLPGTRVGFEVPPKVWVEVFPGDRVSLQYLPENNAGNLNPPWRDALCFTLTQGAADADVTTLSTRPAFDPARDACRARLFAAGWRGGPGRPPEKQVVALVAWAAVADGRAVALLRSRGPADSVPEDSIEQFRALFIGCFPDTKVENYERADRMLDTLFHKTKSLGTGEEEADRQLRQLGINRSSDMFSRANGCALIGGRLSEAGVVTDAEYAVLDAMLGERRGRAR